MNETLTRSPEQTLTKELPTPNVILKSQELFAGDINAAVIAVQTNAGFGIDEDWWNKNVGEANNDAETARRFDAAFKKAYEADFWRKNGISEEQIATVQSHEDYEAASDTTPQQINGINIPNEVAKSEIDPNIWAAEEQQRRLDYVFSGAKFHLNYEFTIGSDTYLVDSISYTGTDGNYETLEIKITNLTTGKVSDYLKPEQVEQMIVSGESRSNETTEQRKQQALDGFNKRFADDEDAPSVAEFEAWLDNHPELQESPEQQNSSQSLSASPQPTTDDTEDFETTFAAMTNPDNWEQVAPDPADAKEEIDAALEAFDQLTADAPEYAGYRTEYLGDLRAKIASKYSPELAEQLMQPYEIEYADA